ncbi:MAG TPA: hypothetical protein VHI13_17435 [Candidatus Kapabacteria bacterium]|nr:hypothetical protein [Candidatus Kapabacteria bacterium]
MINQLSVDAATDMMMKFIQSIGIGVHEAELPHDTFLPGVSPRGASLLVDRRRLLYPGDLLHEAGHIACAPPEQRALFNGNAGDDPAEEMMAIAWSYAAALHIGLDPAIVFHEHGYKGGSASILENFERGRTVGVPMLQWLGMSYMEEEAASRGVPAYPAMVRWIR